MTVPHDLKNVSAVIEFNLIEIWMRMFLKIE